MVGESGETTPDSAIDPRRTFKKSQSLFRGGKMKALHALFVCLFVYVLGASTAQAAGWNTADTFRTQLQTAASQAHTHPLNYSEARRVLLGQLHLQQGPQGYFIHDVYCQKDYTRDDFAGSRGPEPGKAPDDRILNVEHTWPQSRFSGREGATMKSDLHHLFPADSKLNQIRGNFRFGEVSDALPMLQCGYSQIDNTGGGLPHFEPPVVHKGNVARALFYFAVRYGMSIDPEEETNLRAWNQMDPPDDFEMQRNNAIESIQGNRNPFIDHPEYVDQIADF
jgi:deoxyribonuclease-1